jgi:acetolactate synthase-1/2/3 large subunit
MTDSLRNLVRNGGALVVDWMRSRGLNAFFHVPGESFLPVLDALRDVTSVQVITARHEAGAAFAAEAFGKLTGRPAVCMATRGPGASNLSIGVQTAHYDGTPMLVMLGLVPRHLQGAGAFQEIDPGSMFASIAKDVHVVNVAEALVPVLDQALATAVTGRPGPVVVGFPADVLQEAVSATLIPGKVMASATTEFNPEAVLALLHAARRPALLVATEAVRGPAASALEDLAARTGALVYCAWRRFSSFDNGHEQFAGSVGFGGCADVTTGLSQADLVLSFGFAIEQITCDAAGLRNATGHFVQLASESDPRVARYLPAGQAEQVIVDPADAALALAAAANRTRFTRSAQTRSHGPRQAAADAYKVSVAAGAVRMEHVMSLLDVVIPDDAIIVSDAGNFAQWLLRHIKFDQHRVFLGALNGAMGYGLPGGIGAGIAMPERPCWVLAGDGGFAMLEAEMETARRLGLSIVACVFDNGLYGTIRAQQEQAFPGRAFGTSTGHVDFAAAARAHGWLGWSVDKDADIERIVDNVLANTGCRLIHFVVEQFPLAA